LELQRSGRAEEDNTLRLIQVYELVPIRIRGRSGVETVSSHRRLQEEKEREVSIEVMQDQRLKLRYSWRWSMDLLVDCRSERDD